jgi:magnesium-transporting ATPase (P-type)
VESQLQFLGLLALIDPVRPEAAETVARCREAGIRVLLITGDHPGTAAEIARRTGILTGAEPRVVTGSELESMAPAALHAALAQDVVFARTTPVQKLTIVAALQEMDLVVAVIGDGVNDAPSLRRADVGVAMGKGGTDVAREAADIVLLDDNFATIVDAVEEGRAIFANIRKFVTYVFTSNVAELAPFAAFVLAGIPLPLRILQVLAVDLGTDLVPALALGAEPPEPGVLNERPRPKGAPVLDRGVFLRTFLLLGPIEAALGLGGFFFVYWSSGWRPGEPMADSGQIYTLATTLTFGAIVVGQVGNVLACRSARISLFAMPLARNPLLLAALAVEILTLVAFLYLPPLQSVFDFTSPEVREWVFLLLILPILPLLDELRKRISTKRIQSSTRGTH